MGRLFGPGEDPRFPGYDAGRRAVPPGARESPSSAAAEESRAFVKSRTYTLQGRGIESRDGEIRRTAPGEVLGRLRRVAERVTRLRATGVSSAVGARPRWLEETLDFTVTGLGGGSTVLRCRAPCLGETAREPFGRRRPWSEFEPPDLDDTALDLAGEAIRSLDSESNPGAASDARFDRPVIEAIIAFGKAGGVSGVGCTLARDGSAAPSFEWNDAMGARAERRLEQLPSARAYVVTGVLDRIRHRDGRFRLRLRDGRSLSGHLDPAKIEVEALRALRGREATVTGMVHFRPDGAPRAIVAGHLAPYTAADEIFEPLPRSALPGSSVITPEFERLAGEFDWDRIRGAWPGDETIEELLDGLDEIRSPAPAGG